MSSHRQVVVLVRPSLLQHKVTGWFAARIPELGLTAYGKTADEALTKVRRMFASTVYAHREAGTLERWLTSSGVRWWWRDEYDGSLPVEEVVPVDPSSPVGSDSGSREDGWQDVSGPLTVAA